jgi:hypothetical protein
LADQGVLEIAVTRAGRVAVELERRQVDRFPVRMPFGEVCAKA